MRNFGERSDFDMGDARRAGFYGCLIGAQVSRTSF